MTTRYASRKFLLACAGVASATWLVSIGAITPVVYQAVVLGTGGVYITGNVVQKWLEKNSGAGQ